MRSKRARLSPFPYIRHNKRRTGALVISLSVFAMMIYTLGYLLGCVMEPFETNMYGSYAKRTTFCGRVDPGEYETTEEWNEKITPLLEEQRDRAREDLGTDEVYVVRMGSVMLNSIFGEVHTQVYYFDNEADMTSYADHMGAHLVSGRMPENPGEIVVDTMAYKNMGEGLLSSLGDGHTIVGQVECPYYVLFGYPLEIENNAGLMVLHDNENADIVKKLEAKGWDLVSYNDYYSEFEQFHEMIETLEDIKILITAISGTLLGICILVVLSIHIRDRHEEWCLFDSIGFSAFEIYSLAVKELLISFGAAILIGGILSALAVLGLDKFMIDPMGLYVPIIRPNDAQKVLLMLIAIFGLCQIPLFLQIRTINTVDQIE